MPTVYEPVLFVHVLAAAVLIGTMLVEVLAGDRLRRATDLRDVRTWTRFLRPMTPLGGLAWLLLLLSGGHLAGVRWTFAEGWITVSAVALLLAAAAGPLLHGRRLKALAAASAEADGRELPDRVRSGLQDPVLWASVHGLTGVAVGFVYAMTNKPGFAGTALALLLPGAVGAVVGILLARTDSTRAATSR